MVLVNFLQYTWPVWRWAQYRLFDTLFVFIRLFNSYMKMFQHPWSNVMCMYSEENKYLFSFRKSTELVIFLSVCKRLHTIPHSGESAGYVGIVVVVWNAESSTLHALEKCAFLICGWSAAHLGWHWSRWGEIAFSFLSLPEACASLSWRIIKSHLGGNCLTKVPPQAPRMK